MNKLIAVDKSIIKGRAVSCRELLNGLKSKIFSTKEEDSFVTLSNMGNSTELLTVVYKSEKNNRLHLESGNCKPKYESGDILYVDKSYMQHGNVSIEELIDVLENYHGIDLDNPVYISCEEDIEFHPMTMLLKCSHECPAAHIISYCTNELIMN